LSLAQALGGPLLQIEARLLLGQITHFLGNHVEAEVQLEEGIAQLRRIKHPQLLGLGLIYLGNVQLSNGRFEIALQTGQECRRVCEESGDLATQIDAQLLQAQSWLHLGKYRQATVIAQKTLSLSQSEPEYINRHGTLPQLFGLLALVRGDVAEAWAQLQVCHDLFGLGLAAAMKAELDTAQQLLVQGIREAVEQKDADDLAMFFMLAAYLQVVQGEPEQAVALLTLAQQNPFVSNSRWFADVVGNRITTVAQNLSPEVIATAQNRGRSLDMWQTAESLLDALIDEDETEHG
jgi:tetratricopeptide (TPR) repeat protein